MLCSWALSPFEFLLSHQQKLFMSRAEYSIILIDAAKGILSSCPGQGLSCYNQDLATQTPAQGWSLQGVWGKSLCGFQVVGFRGGAHNPLPPNSITLSIYPHIITLRQTYTVFFPFPLPEVSTLTAKVKSNAENEPYSYSLHLVDKKAVIRAYLGLATLARRYVEGWELKSMMLPCGK